MTGDTVRKTVLAAIVLLQMPQLWCRFTYHQPVVLAGGLACARCHRRWTVRSHA